jgi:hypothetical protein
VFLFLLDQLLPRYLLAAALLAPVAAAACLGFGTPLKPFLIAAVLLGTVLAAVWENSEVFSGRSLLRLCADLIFKTGPAIEAEVERILQQAGWSVGTTRIEYALHGGDEDHSLQRLPMPDPNLVAHLNYQRQRLSLEHLGASPGAILQVIVQLPAPPAPPGGLRQALHAALGRSQTQERIEALLAVLPLSADVSVQLSILDAATREARRLDAEQREQSLTVIAQAEYRVLHQSEQWVRYGLLTETQRQGGIAFFAAESWLRTIGPEGQGMVQIGCRLVEANHSWSLDALRDSLDEIRQVDSFSADCWRGWLEQSLPAALQSHQADLLRRLDS